MTPIYGPSELDQSNTTAAQTWQLNNEVDNHYGAQSFVPGKTGKLDKWIWKLYKVGTPGNLVCKLYATDGGSPTGSALSTSASFNAATLSTDTAGAEITFEFPDDYKMTKGTTYWVSIETDWAASGVNYVVLIHSTANPYASGTHNRYSSTTSAWLDDQGGSDDYFKEYIIPQIGETGGDVNGYFEI